MLRINKRGLTLPGLAVVLTVILVVGGILGKAVFDEVKKSKVKTVQSDIAQIESISKTYFMVNNRYPVIEGESLIDSPLGSGFMEIYQALLAQGFTDAQIATRFKKLDKGLLQNGQYLAKLASNEDFVIDITTGRVISSGALDAIAEVLKESGYGLKLSKNVIRVKLEVLSSRMTKVNCVEEYGTGTLVGGKGAMNLALIDSTGTNVTDLTSKLDPDTGAEVGAIKDIGNNQVVVAYYHGGTIKIKTVEI